jgi:TM2 domain-containing membrane protein YozV
MKGKVLEYSVQKNSGLISGDDGSRYSFEGSEWRSVSHPTVGSVVDFEGIDGKASGIYLVAAAGGSKRIAAALLAFFLGVFGAHKFYLGYNTQGVIMLLVSVLGLILIVPTLVIGIISFIEFILYLVKTDTEFEELYVTGERPWF